MVRQTWFKGTIVTGLDFVVGERDWAQFQIYYNKEKWEFIAKEQGEWVEIY